MKFVTINNDLAPIRLLRQVDSITDDELAQFLDAEREFKLQQLVSGRLWVEVLDLRRFAGLSPTQRELCREWLVDNVAMTARTTIGVALAVPPELEQRAQLVTSILEQRSVPSLITNDVDAALYWALERAYDEDVIVDPNLIISGIDAFRVTMA